MFPKTDGFDVFRGVIDLLVNNDAAAYSYVAEKHPKLAGRIRALMERLMAQDPPFMKKVFEAWLQMMRLRNPLHWRQVSQGKMTEGQSAMFGEFVRALGDAIAETKEPKDRLRFWVENERTSRLPLSVIRRHHDRCWKLLP
jgi:hypothetical protein